MLCVLGCKVQHLSRTILIWLCSARAGGLRFHEIRQPISMDTLEKSCLLGSYPSFLPLPLKHCTWNLFFFFFLYRVQVRKTIILFPCKLQGSLLTRGRESSTLDFSNHRLDIQPHPKPSGGRTFQQATPLAQGSLPLSHTTSVLAFLGVAACRWSTMYPAIHQYEPSHTDSLSNLNFCGILSFNSSLPFFFIPPLPPEKNGRS